MKVEDAITKIVVDSDIPSGRRVDVIDLFKLSWQIYYEQGKDVYFETPELRDMWFYIKVYLLSKLVSYTNLKAIDKMSHELNVNAKKFENHLYRTKYVYNWINKEEHETENI